jgi:CPA2 family monovalent cation:H+ antiporter-2
VIPEEFETSIEIFARVLAHYGVGRVEVDRLVDRIRASQYEALRGGKHPSLGAVAGVPQMAMERIRLAPDSPLVGRTIAQSGLRSRTGALILSVRRGTDDIGTPDPAFQLAADDVLVVVGQPEQLRAATQLLTNGRPGSG